MATSAGSSTPAASTPYILGLDLGVASIGWARIECDPADGFKPLRLLQAGAHLFESGTDGGKSGLAGISQGTDKPRNQERQAARQMRRQIWRRARRKRKLLLILIRHGLLPDVPHLAERLGLSEGDVGGNLKRPLDIDAYLKVLDYGVSDKQARTVSDGATAAPSPWVGFAARWTRIGTKDAHADRQNWPYRLRAAAAVGPVDRLAFGRALYHLAQRRGFLSNRRADAKKKETDDERSEMKKHIGRLQQAIDAHVPPTLGAYLASLDPFAQHDAKDADNPAARRLRGRWTSRKMYLDEFERMWNMEEMEARAMGRVPLGEGAREDIWKAIFWQRPLKNQSNLIGHCSLIPAEKRCTIAHRTYQRFRLLQTLNNLLIVPPAAAPRALTAEERSVLLATLTTEGDITFPRARTLCKAKKGTEFNLEAGGEKKIVGHRTDGKLAEVFEAAFAGFAESDRDRMVDDLRSFRLPDALVRRGVKRWGLTSEAATDFANISLEEGYAPLSLAAVKRLMPLLEQGVSYAAARKQVFPDSYHSTEPLAALPPVLKAMPELRNPSVMRALTEARKLINEAVRRYGKPAVIRVELARDVKNPRKVRERITRNIRDREKSRAAIITRIQKEGGIANPRREDIERVMLAEECKWQCPYTGKGIDMPTLLGPGSQFDIEHIWPRSRSLDDSLLNKTLCFNEENRSRKRGHTPREAYGGNEDRFEEIMQRLRAFKCDPFVKAAKIARFEAEGIPDGFSNRHLADTRYIAAAAADYIGLLYGGRVEGSAEGTPGTRRVDITTGGLTAWLRTGWGIDGLLGETGEKNREDHRHHAVDAIVAALSDTRAVQTLARAAEAADRLGKRRAFEQIDEPWPGFREDANAAVQAIIVSHRQSRKVSGPLHDQSIYSNPIGGPNGTTGHRIRKELHKLSVSEIRDGKIIDKRALEAIRAMVREQLGTDDPNPRDLTKLLTEPTNAPLVKGHDGRMVRLRKVRIEADAGRKIGRGASERWVQPANNHHTVIVEVRDAKGRVRWEDRPVQLIEAYARQAAKRPIVARIAGPSERLVFSLAAGEHVEMADPKNAAVRAVWRLRSISEGELKFVRTSDARQSAVSGPDRTRVNAEKMRTLGARKVRISYLGEVLNAGG